jgi:hypothetical protein
MAPFNGALAMAGVVSGDTDTTGLSAPAPPTVRKTARQDAPTGCASRPG